MRRTTRIEIDLIVDEDGAIQVEATNLRRLNDAAQAMCFLTGKPKVTCQCSECAKSSRDVSVAIQPKKRDQIEVVFTHPRDASSFTAIVSSGCTGAQALAGLLSGDGKGPFIDQAPPRYPYELVVQRTGNVIAAKMTLAEVGVLDGEIIEVRQGGQGAGLPWDAIQLSLAYGVGTGAGLALVKALTPVLTQILKNQGSQSMELEVAGVRVKVVGRNSFKKVEAAIRQLAKKYGQNELSASQKPRRLRTKKEAPQLKPRAAKVRKVGALAAKRSRPPRRATGKRTNNTISVQKKEKKNS